MASAGVLAGVGMISSVAGSLTQAAGQEYTGEAQSQMYQYQAAVAQANAQIAKQNAAYDIAAGEVQAEQSGLQTRQQVGMTLAQQGAGNLDVNSGSTKDVRASEETVGEENQALIRNNAARAAYGEEVTAFQYTAQSTLDTSAAATSLVQGQIGATASILGGVSSVASKWSSGISSGVFSSV
jgi:hypothetical protein